MYRPLIDHISVSHHIPCMPPFVMHAPQPCTLPTTHAPQQPSIPPTTMRASGNHAHPPCNPCNYLHQRRLFVKLVYLNQNKRVFTKSKFFVKLDRLEQSSTLPISHSFIFFETLEVGSNFHPWNENGRFFHLTVLHANQNYKCEKVMFSQVSVTHSV